MFRPWSRIRVPVVVDELVNVNGDSREAFSPLPASNVPLLPMSYAFKALMPTTLFRSIVAPFSASIVANAVAARPLIVTTVPVPEAIRVPPTLIVTLEYVALDVSVRV
jgi:hypothetical protein